MADTTSVYYFVVQTMEYAPEGRLAYPSERVTLDHLAQEQIDALIKGNIIMPDASGKVAFQKNLSSTPRRPAAPVPPAVKE